MLNACEDAQRAGYTEIYIPIPGTTQFLIEFMDELRISPGDDPQEYVRFGNEIICLSDAWKEEVEYYELS